MTKSLNDACKISLNNGLGTGSCTLDFVNKNCNSGQSSNTANLILTSIPGISQANDLS